MKSVLAHAILAVGGLTMAYMAWTDEAAPERSPDEVTVWDCEEADVVSLLLEAERRTVKVEKKGKGDTYWWLTTTRLGADDKKESRSFVGSEGVDTYLEKVAPFVAVRSLGDLDKEMLEEVELKKPKTSLTIKCGQRTRKFVVGGRAYGSGDRYLRESKKGKQSGPVYLIKAAVVADLEAAEARLMQRELHRFEDKDVDTLVVKAFGSERTLLHRNRLDPQQAEWVDAAEPDRRNELYGNWLERVDRIRAREYLDPGKEPGDGGDGESVSVQPLMTLIYRDEDGKELGTSEFVKADTSPPEYYARSATTRGWIQVTRSVSQQVERDVRPVVGLEPLDEPEDDAPREASPGASAPVESVTEPAESGDSLPTPTDTN